MFGSLIRKMRIKNTNSASCKPSVGSKYILKALPNSCKQLFLLMMLVIFAMPLIAAPTQLSSVDKHTSVALTADSLGAIFTVSSRHRAVRSTHSIEPGSGFFYYEGHREVDPGHYGSGVATFFAESSFGNTLRLRVALRTTLFSDSMASVV